MSKIYAVWCLALWFYICILQSDKKHAEMHHMNHMKPIFVKANEKDQGTASLEAGIQLSIAWGFSKQPRKARIMDELLPL